MCMGQCVAYETILSLATPHNTVVYIYGKYGPIPRLGLICIHWLNHLTRYTFYIPSMGQVARDSSHIAWPSHYTCYTWNVNNIGRYDRYAF